MNILQQKLNALLEKYSLERQAILKENTVCIDGTDYPLLPERSERRFLELKNIANDGTLKNISVMRISRIVAKDNNIFDELYREYDICQYVLDENIKTVTAMQNGNTLNVIAKTESGIVCTFEIAATLNYDEKPKDKHEIIAERGTACDVVVDAQLKQDSIYLFTDKTQKYTDCDFELYGLNEEEIAIVRAAFNIAKSEKPDELLEIHNNLLTLINATKRSIENGRREIV